MVIGICALGRQSCSFWYLLASKLGVARKFSNILALSQYTIRCVLTFSFGVTLVGESQVDNKCSSLNSISHYLMLP